MILLPLLYVRILVIHPSQMRRKAVTRTLRLQYAVSNVNGRVRPAVQFNKGIEYGVLQSISIRRKGADDFVNVLRDFNRLVQMQSAEVKHVPVRGDLSEITGEVILQAGVKR